MDICRTQILTDIIHGSIAYGGIEREVIGTQIFNRLHHILQSSLVYLTFSSNKVKRFEHSVGTMHLAGNIFFHSICNADPKVNKEFFSCINNEIEGWRKKLDSLPYILPETIKQYKDNHLSIDDLVPKCKLYNSYHPSNIDHEDMFAYFVTFQAVRLAGVLHDVGHLPYSHVIEHALDSLYDRIAAVNKRNEYQNFFIETIDNYRSAGGHSKTPLHEAIGQKLIDRVFAYITENIQRSANPNYIFLACVIDFTKKIIRSHQGSRSIFSELHLIIDGVLDADRLDYCSRDAFCCGMRKDIFPYSRFIPTYQLAKGQYEEHESPLIEKGCSDNSIRKEGFFFCPASKSTREIIDVLERRWRIYVDINYHHRVHKHEALLEEVIVVT